MSDQGGMATPAGWYPEAPGGHVRWWDGTSWGAYLEAHCTYCSAAITAGALGCPSCGYNPRVARNFCATCGGSVAYGQVVCGSCGHPVGGAAAIVAAAGGKDKTVAGVLGILLGGFGVHKFYLGRTNAGVIMLVGSLVGICCGFFLIIPLLAPMAFGVIGLVEGIIYLTKSDEEFQQTYVRNGKDWF